MRLLIGVKMTKKQFLQELKSVFKKQKKEDIKNTLNYYDIVIDDYVKGGATEEEAVACLDTPIEIYNKFCFDYAKDNSSQSETQKNQKSKSIFLIPLIFVAVVCCFVGILLGMLILILMFSIEVILALGGIGGIIGSGFYMLEHIPTALVLLGLSLIAISIVIISVKPFLKFCGICIFISIRGFKNTYWLIMGKRKEIYE